MSGQIRFGRGLAPVAYHQFLISDEDGPAAADLPAAHNGLMEVTDGEIIVPTGVSNSDVDVTVTLHQAEPAPDDGGWQEIVRSPHTPPPVI